MSDKTESRGKLRAEVREILRAGDFEKAVPKLMLMPRRKTLNALASLLVDAEELVRWRAVTAYGKLAAELAGDDPEAGRVVLQRQMWNLNEESGNYARGAAEAMAETMAGDERLAKEFAHVLVSFITPEGLFLDDPELQKGALWGIGRLAEKWPSLFHDALPALAPFLDSDNPELRGLAARAVSRIGGEYAKDMLKALADDHTEIKIYEDGKMAEHKISGIAGQGPAK